MKRLGLIMIVLAAAAAGAQDSSAPQSATQPTAPTTPAQQPAKPKAEISRSNRIAVKTNPTENDMYCSGFVLKEGLPRAGRIAGGWDSPHEMRYSQRPNMNMIYLDRGSFAKDQQFAVVRPIKDLNTYEMTPGEFKNLKAAGQFYQELGRVKVNDVQNNLGIASVEFSCDAMLPGDVLIPWADRPVPTFRKDTPWNFLAQPNGKTTGLLLMGKEYDGLTSQRGKGYINVGSSQGVKAGDYFRVTRTYKQIAKDPADGQSVKASTSDYRMLEPLDKGKTALRVKTRFDAYPRKSIGEVMVLYTTPTTATVTVTRSWEQLQAGDGVELMDEPAPEAEAPAAAAAPPTVTCTASPASVHVGESSTIRCTGASPDNHELTYNYSADSGALSPHNDTAVLNTANAQPGVVTVTTNVTDDRGLAGSTTTKVNVQATAPAAPEASSAGNLTFKPNSAYVNNQSKAMLDQVALRLQQEAGSSAMLAGHVAEKESPRLAIARATNAMNYLVKEKGIDSSRVQVADGGPGAAQVEVWFVPAGAPLPQMTPQPKP